MSQQFSRSWMQTHRHIFGDRPISDLCIPDSHNAGTSRLGTHTKFGTASNVLTQTKSIFDQLELGVRRLDIRPTLTMVAPAFAADTPIFDMVGSVLDKVASNLKTDSLACGHYDSTDGTLGWQGRNGVDLSEVIDDLNRFTNDNAELIIVKITHFYRLRIADPTSSTKENLRADDWPALLNALSHINHLFTAVRAGSKDKPLHDYHLNQFIGNNKAAVVVLVEDYPDSEVLFQHGLWPMKMLGDRVTLDLPGISVTRMQDSSTAVWSTINSFFTSVYPLLDSVSGNPSSVLGLAKTEQDSQFPWLLQEAAANGYASSIEMDKIENLDLITFCLAIMYQRYNIANGLHDMVVVYGGNIVTNHEIRNNLKQAIDKGVRFIVNNNTIGFDPWPGMTKSCAVFYEHNGLIKGRFGRENRYLNFGQDLLSVKYGNKQICDQVVYSRMLRTFASRDRFYVTSDNLGDDQANGIEKTCVVKFRYADDEKILEKEVKDGGYFKF